MPYPIQWILSLIFNIQMYVALVVIWGAHMPLAALNRKYAYQGVHRYCKWVRFSARYIIGLKSEIRGEIPRGEVLVASKHQSVFDVILLASVLPEPKYIMKNSLRFVPFLGFYAMRMGCVPVKRGQRGAAIKRMVAAVKGGAQTPGQLVIYPQGTRVAAGVSAKYKVGAGILYEQTGQACVPAATNIGVFWARQGIYRGRGTAVLEFLPRIEAGLPVKQFMAQIEDAVETKSNVLMEEAGFDLRLEASKG
jgi:1-acyl-sn-glycerol-3-phosphate acyltransferase